MEDRKRGRKWTLDTEEREWTGTNEVKKWTVQREREDAGHGVGARVDSGQGEGQ